MDRITQKQLEAIVARINRATGAPMTAWTRNGDKFTANIGNYHLSGAYGGVCLHRIVNDVGGVSDVFRCGHVSKRALAEKMWAFLVGHETASGQPC